MSASVVTAGVGMPWARSDAGRAIEMLTFVRNNPAGGGRNFWAVPDLSSYSMECALGGVLGREALGFMAQYDRDAWFLGNVVASMIRRGEATGIEVGFARVIARAAIRGATL